MKLQLLIILGLLTLSNLAYSFAPPVNTAFRFYGEEERSETIGVNIFRTVYQNGFPYQIFDHEVNSFVRMFFENAPEASLGSFFSLHYDQQVSEHLAFMENEDNHDLLALAKVINSSRRRLGPQYERRDITVSVKFVEEMHKIISPILSQIRNLEVEDKLLSFTTSKIEKLDHFFVYVYVAKKSVFSEKVVFSGKIPVEQLELSPFGEDRTMVMVDLQEHLEGIEAGKKYLVRISAGLNFNDYIILNERYSHLPMYRTKEIKTILE